MSRWRDAFQHGRPGKWDVEFGYEFTFGPPATEMELAEAETALGLEFPSDVRELLSEFNGVFHTSRADRENGWGPTLFFLNVPNIAKHVPHYLATSDNPLPRAEDLAKVIFVRDTNGFGVLWGVCVIPFAEFVSGQVLRLDHERGQFEFCSPSLYDFVHDIK